MSTTFITNPGYRPPSGSSSSSDVTSQIDKLLAAILAGRKTIPAAQQKLALADGSGTGDAGLSTVDGGSGASGPTSPGPVSSGSLPSASTTAGPVSFTANPLSGATMQVGPFGVTASPFGSISLGAKTGNPALDMATSIVASRAGLPALNLLTMMAPGMAPLGLAGLGPALTIALGQLGGKALNAAGVPTIDSTLQGNLEGAHGIYGDPTAMAQAIAESITQAQSAQSQASTGHASPALSNQAATQVTTNPGAFGLNPHSLNTLDTGLFHTPNGPAFGVKGLTIEGNKTLNLDEGDTGTSGTGVGQGGISGGPVGATGVGPPGVTGDPNSTGQGATGTGGVSSTGPGTASGPGNSPGDGGGGGGAGCLLANWALDKLKPKDAATAKRFYQDFYTLFMQANPQHGKRAFAVYQKVARLIIDKVEAAGPDVEKTVQRYIYTNLIQPTGQYLEKRELGGAVRHLAKIIRVLAGKFDVPLPKQMLKLEGQVS